MTDRSWIERAAAGEDVEPPVMPERGTERDLIGADGKRVTPGPLDENPVVVAARAKHQPAPAA